jgi:hypothetical protein
VRRLGLYSLVGAAVAALGVALPPVQLVRERPTKGQKPSKNYFRPSSRYRPNNIKHAVVDAGDSESSIRSIEAAQERRKRKALKLAALPPTACPPIRERRAS